MNYDARQDLVLPPITTTPNIQSLKSPFAQPEDGPTTGPKHVVVITFPH
jgi:hypothetical protein